MKRTSLFLALLFLVGLFLVIAKPSLFFFAEREDLSDFVLEHEEASLRIGHTTIHLNLYKHGSMKFVYFNLHDNENTSVQATIAFIKKHGGYFVEIKAQDRRLITFTLNGNQYTFDPNRIFTDDGIKKTLKKYGDYSEDAHQAITLFVESLLEFIVTDSLETIIAVHNNTDSNYSIKSYLKGRDEENNAKDSYLNPNMDPDDFFYVTNEEQFDFFKAKQYNVILQDETKVIDDGSLSVYCRIHGIRYINVEAQHGHLKEQKEMLSFVRDLLTIHAPDKRAVDF